MSVATPTLTSTWDVRAPGENVVIAQGERAAYWVVAALLGLLGLLGFVNSFAAVEAAARPSFGALSWTVPVGVDLGIAVFVALDLTMTRTGMRLPWLRTVPWALSAATVYLNTAHESDPVAIVGHAALPGLWILAVEVGAHVVRHRFALTAPRRVRLDRVRLSRWALAPVPTARLRRRMILWEEPSYRAALDRERDRLLSLCGLQDRYGRVAWRWKAPRVERVRYRLGDLSPALALDPGSVAAPPPPSPPLDGRPDPDLSSPRSTRPGDDLSPRPVPVLRPPSSNGSPPTPPAQNGTARPRPSATAGGEDPLLPVAREVAAAAGGPVGRDRLVRELRERGHALGTARAGQLVAALRAEP